MHRTARFFTPLPHVAEHCNTETLKWKLYFKKVEIALSFVDFGLLTIEGKFILQIPI